VNSIPGILSTSTARGRDMLVP
jgi:hypothetical protein